MLPDANLGIDGFHDIIIENLTASLTWRSSHISPADNTALCRAPPSMRTEKIGPGVSS